MINIGDLWFIAMAACCVAGVVLAFRGRGEAAFALLTAGLALWLAAVLVYGNAPQAFGATVGIGISLRMWWRSGGSRRLLSLPLVRAAATRYIGGRAEAALAVSVAGDIFTGHVIVRQVLERFGPAAAAPLTQVWTGILGDLFPEEQADAESPVAWQFRSHTTHESLTVHEVPARLRWSGWVITAATSHDSDMVTAMVEALPKDETDLEEHLGTLLDMAVDVMAAIGGAGADERDAS